MLYTQLLAALAFGYLLGSIPFGLLITRAAGLGDVRNIGSGNIGATNVLRTGNKGLAALTLILDALKGTAAVLIAWDIFSRSGWASRAARAWRLISAFWPVSPGTWRWSSPQHGSRWR
jgi:acyl-phosphate glycerol 3-phosphate acyltransferase